MKYCSNCGAEIHEEAVICPKCGCAVPRARLKGTWGDVLGRIGLPIGIIALIFGILSLIPLAGLVFIVFDIIFGFTALSFGIVGSIKAVGKGKCITTIIFGSIALVTALIMFEVIFVLSLSTVAITAML